MSSKVAIIFAIVGVVAIGVVYTMLRASDVNLNIFARGDSAESQTRQFVTTVIPGRDHLRGAENPQVVWIEYSDFECPFCKKFHPTMIQVISEYGDDVQWVYRHFPIAALHPGASIKAEASECAAELGGEEVFWHYSDLIFERSDATGAGLGIDDLAPLAAELGLNQEAFQTCLESGRYSERVQDDLATGTAAGVQGTPTSFVIGPDGKAQVIEGLVPYAQVRSIIEGLLR
ncbi:thioredoxin domain-containing protein [Patescibacteria group bacterium]|nr:thioredoxin domain-containing protein [Patescibacteria group bacterium]